MKIGISTASLTGLETEDALALLKEAGAETCEIYLKTFYEYRPEFAKKFAERAAGVEVNAIRVNPYNFEAQLFSPSRRVRGDGFYWLDQVLRSAQLFGAKNYIFNGLVWKDGDKDDFDFIAERLREVADFCARYGVTLCLETLPTVFKELKARCPQITGALDISPIIKYLQDMQGVISHIYISGVDKKVFSQLKAAGFNGTVIIKRLNSKDVENLKEVIYNIK